MEYIFHGFDSVHKELAVLVGTWPILFKPSSQWLTVCFQTMLFGLNSNFPRLRRELRKLGTSVPSRPATHHGKWMWQWETRPALPTAHNHQVLYLDGPSQCQASCTCRSPDMKPQPFFQNKPREPLFCVAFLWWGFPGPDGWLCSLTLASNYCPHSIPSVVVSELGMEVYLNVLSSVWNTSPEKHDVPCNFHSFGFLFSLGILLRQHMKQRMIKVWAPPQGASYLPALPGVKWNDAASSHLQSAVHQQGRPYLPLTIKVPRGERGSQRSRPGFCPKGVRSVDSALKHLLHRDPHGR